MKSFCHKFLATFIIAGLVITSLALPLASVAASKIPNQIRNQKVPDGYNRQALHLKFKEGTTIRLRGQHFVGLKGEDVSALNQVLSGYNGIRIVRLFNSDENQISQDKANLEASSHKQLADFNLYYKLILKNDTKTEQLLDDLQNLSIVEKVYAESKPAPAPTSPNFVNLQTYFNAAPNGMNVNYAQNYPGGTGSKVKVIDLEYSWNRNHEDLAKLAAPSALIPNGTSYDPFNNDNHGTAVLGVLGATKNSFGVTGIVPNANLAVVPTVNQERGWDLANSINLARQNLSAGDVMLIEQQAIGANGSYSYVPVEWIDAVYDAIVAANAAGIIVIEPAGNGGENLDNPVYGSTFPNGKVDSGAIVVGAGSALCNGGFSPAPLRSRLSLSSYGRRVNLQGWGNCVTTTGWYGDLTPSAPANAWYSAGFNGTSSASAMVAASAASFSSAFKTINAYAASPIWVRVALTYTGTPQDTTSSGSLSGNIGSLPNLQSALKYTDGQAPSVTIIYPSNNAVLKGITSFDAGASDNVGVSSVKYYLNNVYVGTATPTIYGYILIWDSRTKPNGVYTLTAKATDAAGNTKTSQVVSVRIAN